MTELQSKPHLSRDPYPPRAALITGGTRGLGKAIGLEFAKVGTTVYLTHRWGSADESAIATEFRAHDVPAPRIVERDVSNASDTRALMQTIRDEVGALDIVISNVAFAKP